MVTDHDSQILSSSGGDEGEEGARPEVRDESCWSNSLQWIPNRSRPGVIDYPGLCVTGYAPFRSGNKHIGVAERNACIFCVPLSGDVCGDVKKFCVHPHPLLLTWERKRGPRFGFRGLKSSDGTSAFVGASGAGHRVWAEAESAWGPGEIAGPESTMKDPSLSSMSGPWPWASGEKYPESGVPKGVMRHWRIYQKSFRDDGKWNLSNERVSPDVLQICPQRIRKDCTTSPYTQTPQVVSPGMALILCDLPAANGSYERS